MGKERASKDTAETATNKNQGHAKGALGMHDKLGRPRVKRHKFAHRSHCLHCTKLISQHAKFCNKKCEAALRAGSVK